MKQVAHASTSYLWSLNMQTVMQDIFGANPISSPEFLFLLLVAVLALLGAGVIGHGRPETKEPKRRR